MYHRRLLITIWISTVFASLTFLTFFTGDATANMNSEPLLDKDRTFPGILLTFILNFPLNLFIILASLALVARYSRKLKLTIPTEKYFLRLLGATFLLTWFGAFVDYTVFVLVDSLAGYIVGLFAIGLSFYIAVRYALQHDVPVSVGVAVLVVVMNAVAWILIMRIRIFELYLCCFPFSITMFLICMGLTYGYKKLYRERYHRNSFPEPATPEETTKD